MRKMTTFLKLSVLGALFLGVAGFYSCTPPTEEETLAAPTNAKITDITSVGAKLMWDAVEGAELYEIQGTGGIPSEPETVSGTSKTYTTLQPNTPVTWEVRAVKGSTKSAWATGESFTTLTPTIPAPTNLRHADLKPTSVNLVWDAAAGAEKYLLVVTGGGRIEETPIEVTEGESESLSDLEPDVTYTWSVKTVIGGFQSEPISGGFTTPEVSNPTNARASEVLMESATLTWTPGEFETEYIIKINELNAGAEFTATGNSHRVEGLAPNTNYSWQIKGKLGDYRASAFVDGEAFTTEAVQTPVPTGLTATEVTDKSAILSWQHADADSHEVRLNNGEAIPVTGLTHTATGLDPETLYNWQVRSTKDGVWSDWATGPQFTTEIETTIFPYSFGRCWGDAWGNGTSNFLLELTTFDFNGNDLNGWQLLLDINAPLVAMGPDKVSLEIPAGTYDFVEFAGSAPAANTVLLNYLEDDGNPATDDRTTFLKKVVNGSYVPAEEPIIVGGTMTVAVSNSNYTISFDLDIQDGSIFVASYTGTMYIANPEYKIPFESLLGSYSAAGTPSWFTVPGSPTWRGDLGRTQANPNSQYILSNFFDANNTYDIDWGNLLINWIDGALMLDDGTPVASGTSEEGYPVMVTASVITMPNGIPTNVLNEGQMDLIYDPVSRTISFPTQAQVSSGIVDLAYGFSYFQVGAGGARGAHDGLGSDLYMDLVINLDSGSATGRKVSAANLYNGSSRNALQIMHQKATRKNASLTVKQATNSVSYARYRSQFDSYLK